MVSSAKDKNNKAAAAESVRVIVRCRPMNEKEISENFKRVVEIDSSRGVIEIRNPNSDDPPRQFTFDTVYDWSSKQQDLYVESFSPIVEAVLSGFNGTIFAYGQTGTGKTHTMLGIKNDPEQKGVIPNAFEHIFNHIARSENQQYLIRASYLEIYQEDIRDLLCKDQSKKLDLKEKPDTGVYVKDLSSFVCKSIKEIEHVMNVGNQNRTVGATNMNEHSSRSHAILMVTVECSEIGQDGKNHIRVGRLNLVDLAGSERQAKTGASGERLKEATRINLSLSALGNVISALVDGRSTHIPYRDSKLTRLLQDSLGGNAKTVMVANIGPASYNYDETLTTLRYASRAKNIKNKPRVNEDPKDALLREFQEEIARLKANLANKSGKKKKKKRRERPDSGISETMEDSEPDDDGSDVDRWREEANRLEREKAKILNDQHMIAEEKESFLTKLKEKEELLLQERENQNKLSNKIKAMESKLLCGGKNILDHTNEQQLALEHRQYEIAEQKRKEREMLQQLEEQEETAVEIQQTYSSLQQEVDVKTKKLKKLFSKLQAIKQEINDMGEEFSRDRTELLQTENNLMRELKLRYLIIENFIPEDERQKLLTRAAYDEDSDQWYLEPPHKQEESLITKRPSSCPGVRRPISEFARIAASVGSNPRFKGENILALDLDMPARTTQDYESPSVGPRVQAALEAALMSDQEDINIDASTAVPQFDQKKALPKEKRRIPRLHPAPTSHYPQSRGLVPKR